MQGRDADIMYVLSSSSQAFSNPLHVNNILTDNFKVIDLHAYVIISHHQLTRSVTKSYCITSYCYEIATKLQNSFLVAVCFFTWQWYSSL